MKRNENFLLKNVGGENLLVPICSEVKRMNGVIIFNATASYIWSLLAEDRQADDLASAVAAQFGEHLNRAHADVARFLDDIARLGLLEK